MTDHFTEMILEQNLKKVSWKIIITFLFGKKLSHKIGLRCSFLEKMMPKTVNAELIFFQLHGFALTQGFFIKTPIKYEMIIDEFYKAKMY